MDVAPRTEKGRRMKRSPLRYNGWVVWAQGAKHLSDCPAEMFDATSVCKPETAWTSQGRASGLPERSQPMTPGATTPARLNFSA